MVPPMVPAPARKEPIEALVETTFVSCAEDAVIFVERRSVAAKLPVLILVDASNVDVVIPVEATRAPVFTPSEARIVPVTSSACDGFVLKIPTFPPV